MFIMNLQQGRVGVGRPEGKLPVIPFLTIVGPEIPVNKSHSQTNFKTRFQLIYNQQKKTSLPIMILKYSLIVYPLWVLLKSSFSKKDFNILKD